MASRKTPAPEDHKQARAILTRDIYIPLMSGVFFADVESAKAAYDQLVRWNTAVSTMRKEFDEQVRNMSDDEKKEIVSHGLDTFYGTLKKDGDSVSESMFDWDELVGEEISSPTKKDFEMSNSKKGFEMSNSVREEYELLMETARIVVEYLGGDEEDQDAAARFASEKFTRELMETWG